MNSVFSYIDYREFLSDRISALKEGRRGFTYRNIAELLGLKSAGHITQILKGRASITDSLLPKVLKVFEINSRERDYFTLLVRYAQAPSMNEKRELLKKISSSSDKKSIKINREQYKFYQKWYYAAIRDILDIVPFKGDFKELAQMVEPAISTQEARETISTLEKLEIIQKSEAGIYNVTSKIITSEPTPETRVILSGYADEMIGKASYALNSMEPSERTISWAGFSVSDDGFRLIQDEIREFRERVMNIVEEDKAASRVYHMNIHCFPISKDVSEVE